MRAKTWVATKVFADSEYFIMIRFWLLRIISRTYYQKARRYVKIKFAHLLH